MCGHLGLPIGTILAIFNLKVIFWLQCKFQLKSPNDLGGEVRKLVVKIPAMAAILDLESARF